MWQLHRNSIWTNILTYINLLRKKLTYTRALGADILDQNFTAIIINSLLPS